MEQTKPKVAVLWLPKTNQLPHHPPPPALGASAVTVIVTAASVVAATRAMATNWQKRTTMPVRIQGKITLTLTFTLKALSALEAATSQVGMVTHRHKTTAAAAPASTRLLLSSSRAVPERLGRRRK